MRRKFLPNYVQSFFPMERPWFAVQSQASEIVKAIGKVGILFHLKKNQARPERVHRPRWNIGRLIGLGAKAVNEVAGGFFFKCGAQFFFGDAGFQSQQNFSLIVGLDEIPHFTFPCAALIVEARVIIARVYLNREPVAGVKVLRQNWKSMLLPTAPQESGAVFLRGFRQREVGERAVQESRLAVGDPDFPNQIDLADFRCRGLGAGRKRFRAFGALWTFRPFEKGLQAVPSPYFWFENRGELERVIEFVHMRFGVDEHRAVNVSRKNPSA